MRWFFLLLTPLPVTGQVTVTGHDTTYAGKELVFMRYSDWITMTEEITGSCRVDSEGFFSIDFPEENTGLIFTYLGIYRAYFYAEPGHLYNLILPAYLERTTDQRLNPYFQYTDVHLAMNDLASGDLNLLIMEFDAAYDSIYQKHVNDLYGKPDPAAMKDDIDQVELRFAGTGNQFFNNYRHYMYGTLKLLSQQQRAQSLSDEYFNNYPVLYCNPVYGELFNQVFDKYFVFYGRTDEGKQIYDDINRNASYHDLSKTLSRSNNFSNDTLRELVILKELHDEYYSDQFSRRGLLNILDTLIMTTTIEKHKEIGFLIRDKITRLQAGFEPPQFELEDQDGNMVSLSDFKGEYIYLNFCTFQSYTCLNEFNMLAALQQKYGNVIKIVTITTDPESDEFRQYRIKNNYNWIFLHYDKYPEVLKEYDIRAFPTYFLIGPDGKLILSPAPSPSENFESRLIEILRSRGDLQFN